MSIKVIEERRVFDRIELKIAIFFQSFSSFLEYWYSSYSVFLA